MVVNQAHYFVELQATVCKNEFEEQVFLLLLLHKKLKKKKGKHKF
jgi:hypothetical protein